MNHMIREGILEVLFIVFFDNLFEEIIGVPVVKPGTASYLLIPGVTKVVAPTFSPPDMREPVSVFFLSQNRSEALSLTQFPCNIGQRQIHLVLRGPPQGGKFLGSTEEWRIS